MTRPASRARVYRVGAATLPGGQPWIALAPTEPGETTRYFLGAFETWRQAYDSAVWHMRHGGNDA